MHVRSDFLLARLPQSERVSAQFGEANDFSLYGIVHAINGYPNTWIGLINGMTWAIEVVICGRS